MLLLTAFQRPCTLFAERPASAFAAPTAVRFGWSVSCPPGGAVARTGLRMMPTFPLLPLKFRRADLLRYGFKAGLSNGAFPSSSEVFASCGLHPSFVPIACRSKSSY
jgi:hypothetical protein